MAILTRGFKAMGPSVQVQQDDTLREDQESEEPLPAPEWGSEPEPLELSSLVTFDLFLQELRDILGSELERHPYNTVGSFLAFYDAFLHQGQPLEDFFRSYRPGILPKSLSCVGLAQSLVERSRSVLGDCYPGLKSAMFIASCEEMVIDVENYIKASPEFNDLSVKEHCLVVLKILVEGREGYVVLDPGYHVNIPVIVMADGLYPNTGWFLLSDTPKSKKEYNYSVDGNYINWQVKETRNGKVSSWTNLIYASRKFLSYINVSEKRNLVFNFRTIVARDKRQPVAGLYCNLEGDERFTFFYTDESYKRVEVKIPFDYFQGKRENNQFESAISSCVAQIGLDGQSVSDMVVRITEAYYDQSFMPSVLYLNRKIDEE